MNLLKQKHKALFCISFLTCLHIAFSFSGIAQEMIVLASNTISIENDNSEKDLLVLPTQNIYSEIGGSAIDFVSTSAIEITFQKNCIEDEISAISNVSVDSKTGFLIEQDSKNNKTVSVQLNNKTVSVFLSNKNGSNVESIATVSVSKEQHDFSKTVAVISDKIFIADGNKLKLSHDLNTYCNQVFNFDCNIFSVSSNGNNLAVKLVNGAEFIFNTESDLTLLSFLPSEQAPSQPLKLLNTVGFSATDLNFSIVKDLKHLSSVYKKKIQTAYFNDEKFVYEQSSGFDISHKTNLWSPITGTVYDSGSLDLISLQSFQTNPNFTQSNIQIHKLSGEIYFS